MEWGPILLFLQGLAPWAIYVLMGLGTLVLLGTVIDSLIPDEKDGGFMKKVMGIPVLGSFLEALKRFSPLNVKPKEEPKE